METEPALIEIKHETPEEQSSRGLGLSEPTLLDPHRLHEDTRLVARAIKLRWPIKDEKAAILIERLFDITEKTAVTVMTKEGPESLDGPADVNAISAARVIVQMMGQNQSDEHHADDQANPQPTSGISVNVAVQAGIAAEPEYLEWKREQFRRRHGDSSNVGCNGFAATILDSQPHLGNGQGSH